MTNKYLEKIAKKVELDTGEVGRRFARRVGRIGKGVFGIGADLASTFSGRKTKDVIAEGSKTWVKSPFSGRTYQETLPQYKIDELANLSDSKKINYLSARHGKSHELVSKLKGEINKRDAMRLGVGLVGVGVAHKKVRDYLEERRMYNDYYNV